MIDSSLQFNWLNCKPDDDMIWFPMPDHAMEFRRRWPHWTSSELRIETTGVVVLGHQMEDHTDVVEVCEFIARYTCDHHTFYIEDDQGRCVEVEIDAGSVRIREYDDN